MTDEPYGQHARRDEHDAPEPVDAYVEPVPATRTPEPVVLSHAINIIVVTLVSTGWFTLDSATISSISTAVGALVAIAVALLARSKVTPVR